MTEDPSGLCGERRALNLAVVGLTSPIFAKAGSTCCRAVHENGNPYRLISDYKKRSATDSKEKGVRYRTASGTSGKRLELIRICVFIPLPTARGSVSIPFPRRGHRQLDLCS